MATARKKILTIDDEEAIVDLIVDILETHDYEAIRANKWTEAVDALNHENPDLVLLDLEMPTVDGASMLNFIRAEGFDIPVIIVSGFVTDTVAEELSKQGVSGFVHKPFKARQLLSQIEQALGQQPQTAQTAPPPSKFQTPLDALYGQSLQSVPEAEDEEPAPASVDLLYQGKDQKEEPIDTPETSQTPATEILQAFQKLEKPSETEQPPAPAEKPPAGELLEALNQLDKRASVEDPPQPASSPAPAAIPAPNNPEPQPPEPAQPSPALDNPLTAQPSPLDPAAARSRGQAPAPPISRPEPKLHPRRPPPRRSAIGRKNWMYMGIITFVCVLVAGVLAVMQYVASEFDPKAFQAQAQKSISKQATQEILKELQKSQGR
ncbi:MAG: response regulator [bacterium]|nr:response regulator [bacterium]